MKRNISALIVLVLLSVLLTVPVCAETSVHVFDEAALLTARQQERLEAQCMRIEEQYDCGVYIVTAPDHDGEVYDAAEEIYEDWDLGVSEDQNGVLLLLSMDERDFAIYVHGDVAEYAFDDYGQLQLEEAFLPYLEENDFSGGLQAYSDTCEEFLELADSGKPVRKSKVGAVILAIVISFSVSLIVCLILRSGMKNAKRKTQAAAYAGRLNLTRRIDLYTHTTRTRTKIETKSESRSGGRSGKF